MKTLFYKSLFLLSLIMTFSSCGTNDLEYTDVKLTAVNNLYEPIDAKAVTLLSSTTASLFFEWEASKAEDSGSPMYEVVFDKVGGDFSDPIYRVVSDNSGFANNATITHKVLNSIAGLAGIASAETGSVIWTIISSRGIGEVKAKLSRTLTITRLAGFSEIPGQVFITGEATEAGTTMANASAFTSTANGEYEVFTRLTAGKKYQFVDKKTGTPRTFYVDGGKLKETGDATATKTGIYRISLDFNLGTATLAEVTKVSFFMCSPQQDVELAYQGKGVWKGTDIAPEFFVPWNDNRYYFKMNLLENGAESTTKWGSKNWDNSSSPSLTEAASYFYLVPTSDKDQWGYSYKFPDVKRVATTRVDFELFLNADVANYTHTVTYK